MFKRFSAGDAPLDIIEEREKIFRLLPSVSSQLGLKPHPGSYTIDPVTRYRNLKQLVPLGDIRGLYDTDQITCQKDDQPATLKAVI